MGDWAFQWKMQFNLDPNKQANEVIFSRNIYSHPSLTFNNNDLKGTLMQIWKFANIFT